MKPLKDALIAADAGGQFNTKVEYFMLYSVVGNVVASRRLILNVKQVPIQK